MKVSSKFLHNIEKIRNLIIEKYDSEAIQGHLR